MQLPYNLYYKAENWHPLSHIPTPKNKNPLKRGKTFLSMLSLMKNQIKIVSNQNSHTASFICIITRSPCMPYAIIGTTNHGNFLVLKYNKSKIIYLHEIKQIASLVYIAKILSSKKETGLIFYHATHNARHVAQPCKFCLLNACSLIFATNFFEVELLINFCFYLVIEFFIY